MDKKLLFFDIETVAETNNYDTYPKKKVWSDRYCNDTQWLSEEKFYYKNAWLNPEFSKIICISFGRKWTDDEIKTSSLVWDEKHILEKFFELLSKLPEYELAWHNIKNFDLPFIFRRAIINGIKPHSKVSFYWLKPRDIQVTDTIEIRKNGWYLSTGLETLTLCLGIPSPKTKISWDQIFSFYYSDKYDEDIVKEYCEWDVKATMMVYDKIYDPTKTFATTQPELFPDSVDEKVKRQMMASEVLDKAKDIERLKSFEIEAMMFEEIEKKYEITEGQKQVLSKARREVRNQENGSNPDDDLPF